MRKFLSKLHSLLVKLQKSFRQAPLLYTIIIVLVLAGGFLRLYKISNTLMFQGDQGRDAIIVARMFTEFDPAFIGPVTSIGNMYLGPFYYYFMLPWLLLSYPSPVGPAIGVALVNTLAIALMYFLGRRLVGPRAALWGSFFLAFSGVAIIYSRFSWNPNLSALFGLLSLYFLHSALSGKIRSWVWLGLILGLTLQLHYVNLILIAVAGLFWLYQIWQNRRQKSWFKKVHFWPFSFAALGAFILTCVPLLLFDYRYDWRNLNAGLSIFTAEESFQTEAVTGLANNLAVTFQGLQSRLTQVMGQLFVPEFPVSVAFFVFCLLALLAFLYLTYKKRHHPHALGYQIIALTTFLTILISGLYRHAFFDHYLLFVLPALFLLYGALLSMLPRRLYGYLISALFAAAYLVFNYSSTLFQPSNMLSHIDQITDQILTQIDPNRQFAFSFVNNNRDSIGEHYRYFLETKTDNLVSLEEIEQAQTMFIVDETKEANIYDLSSFDVVIFRDQATASATTFNNVIIHQLEKTP